MAIQQRKKWLYGEKMTHQSPIECFYSILQYTVFICNSNIRSRKVSIDNRNRKNFTVLIMSFVVFCLFLPFSFHIMLK